MRIPHVFVVAFATALACAATAQNAKPAIDPALVGRQIVARLDSGDVITGRLASIEPEALVVESPVFGALRVPILRLTDLQPGTPDEVGQDPDSPDVMPAIPTEPRGVDAPPEADEPAPPAPAEDEAKWTRRFEVGLDGAAGFEERLDIRTVLDITREIPDELWELNAAYLRNSADGETTANRFNTYTRYTWERPESRWDRFVEAAFLWDEFEDYDYLLRGGAGLGYRFIDNERTTLRGRVGAGAAREFGSDDDDIKPELILGLALAHQLTERQSITASAEYLPDISEFGDYRAVLQAAWELEIEQDPNLSLRAGIEDRLDSTREDDELHDLRYFLGLVYSF